MSAVNDVRTALEHAREDLCDLLLQATFCQDTGGKSGPERELALMKLIQESALEVLNSIRKAEFALYDVRSDLTGCGPCCPARREGTATQ